MADGSNLCVTGKALVPGHLQRRSCVASRLFSPLIADLPKADQVDPTVADAREDGRDQARLRGARPWRPRRTAQRSSSDVRNVSVTKRSGSELRVDRQELQQ